MKKKRNRGRLRVIDRIEVTPLVDLTFLLLIVFMITAPALEHAVEVQPPALNATPPGEESYLIFSLDRQGRIFIDRERVEWQQLPARLQRLAAATPPAIFIRADERRPYGEVMALMREARKAGLQNISLITEAEKK